MRKATHAIPPSVRVDRHLPVKATRQPRKAALLSGVLLLVFFAVLYGAVPDRLPLLIQRMVGLTSALLVMLFVTLCLGELGRHYRHFGLSGARFTRILGAVGWVVFVIVLAWWFTRLCESSPTRKPPILA